MKATNEVNEEHCNLAAAKTNHGLIFNVLCLIASPHNV